MTYLLHGKPVEPDDPRWRAIGQRVRATETLHKGPETSRQAAKRAGKTSEINRLKVLKLLSDGSLYGPTGASNKLNLDPDQIRPRFTQLHKADPPLIREVDREGETKFKNPEARYAITEAGRIELARNGHKLEGAV